MPTDAQSLLTEANCYACYADAATVPLMKLALLARLLNALVPGSDTSPQTLLRLAKCYECYSPGDMTMMALVLKRRIVEALEGITPECDTTYALAIPDGFRMGGFATDGTTGVIVGNAGHIYTTTDGVNWNPETSNTTRNLRDVIWDGTRFIAVGDSRIVISSDGHTWVASTLGTDLNTSISFSGSHYVVPDDDGVVRDSPDGSVWTPLALGTGSPLYASAYGGGKWIVAGDQDEIWLSLDGSNWTLQTSGTSGVQFFGATYGDGKFVVVGTGGTILYSTNGVNWSAATVGSRMTFDSVTYGGCPQFVAVANDGDAAGEIWISDDAATWTKLNDLAVYPTFVRLWQNAQFTVGTWP